MTKTFIDTAFVVAVVNQRDQYHAKATELSVRYEGRQFLTTDAVLLEIGNALAGKYRLEAVAIVERLRSSKDVELVHITPRLFEEAFSLYRSHADKDWGLTDCCSFVAMRHAGIRDALTCDQHFLQAGFRALMQVVA